MLKEANITDPQFFSHEESELFQFMLAGLTRLEVTTGMVESRFLDKIQPLHGIYSSPQ